MSGSDIEVIVVDDASTDETSDVCGMLAGVKYLRVERNQRVAGARNVGLVASQGKYITFLDDDDRRLPGSLDAQIKEFERHPQAGLIYGQALYADKDGDVTGQFYPAVCASGDVFWRLLARNFIPCGATVFKRSCLETIGMLDDRIPGLDDWDLWIRIAELFPVVAFEHPVVTWRRASPVSGQGSSAAGRLVSSAVRKFKSSWLELPRAAAAPRVQRREAWRAFSENMLEHLLVDAARAAAHGRLLLTLKSSAVIPRLELFTPARVIGQRVRSRGLKRHARSL